MGRRNTRGMELSFHKASKRWRKRVSGVDHYFGTGKGVSDRVGYQRALKAYKRWQAQQEEKTEVQAAYDDTMERLLQCTGQYTLPPNMPDLSKLMHYFQAGPPLTRDERIAQILSSPILSKLLEPLEDEQPTPKRSTLDEVFDAYIAQIDHRYSMSESNVATVNAKDRLGASMYRTLANSVKAVRGHFKTVGLTSLDDMTKVEAALRSFREQLDARVAKGEISGGYVYALIRSVRPMFTLAWENRIIPELPRCLSAISTKPRHEAQAKPLTKKQVHQLWAAGDDRMRCWVALGLNCGLYAIDISDMLAAELIEKGGCTHLARRRSKTKAPGKWKLWPVTVELIKRVRNDQADGRLFATPKGQPLIVKTKKSVSDHIANQLYKLLPTAGTNASFSQLRDTGAAFVEKWGRAKGDNLATSAYLAHADSRMARNYLATKPADIDSGNLDQATDGFGKHLDLKL